MLAICGHDGEGKNACCRGRGSVKKSLGGCSSGEGSPLDPLLENPDMEYPRNIHDGLKKVEKGWERERCESKVNLGVVTDGKDGLGFVGETRRLRKRVHGYEVERHERFGVKRVV